MSPIIFNFLINNNLTREFLNFSKKIEFFPKFIPQIPLIYYCLGR